MPIDFPDTPTAGDTFEAGGRTWSYNGSSWENVASQTNIGAGTITEANLANASVTSSKIASNAVVETSISDGSVTSTKIASGAVTETLLSNGAVTASKIATNTITNAQIANATIGQNQIANSAVTNAKLANSSVTIGNTVVTLGSSVSSLVELQGIEVLGTTEVNTIREKVALFNSAGSTATKIYAGESATEYYLTGMSGNFTIDVRGINGGADLMSLLATGEMVTVSIINDNSVGTSYYCTDILVDASTQIRTLYWQGGTAPSSGNALDVYTITIIARGQGTCDVFASQTKFA